MHIIVHSFLALLVMLERMYLVKVSEYSHFISYRQTILNLQRLFIFNGYLHVFHGIFGRTTRSATSVINLLSPLYLIYFR